MNRLTRKERNNDGSGMSNYSMINEYVGGSILSDYASDVLTKLADYEDLEEQGLLIKLDNNDPDAVIEVLEEYLEKEYEQKEKKKIKVGDVVEYEDVIGVVLDFDEEYVSILDENGIVSTDNISCTTKTNESLKDDVDVLLGKLRNISYLMEIGE